MFLRVMAIAQQYNTTETLVLGAGYAGLTAASLLAKAGGAVTVLEAHETIGGCAGFFRVGKYSFDVGATTLTGFGKGQPAERVFSHLDIDVDVHKVDPGQVIRTREGDILRHVDVDQWKDEAARWFPQGNQAGFWDEIHALNDKAWDVVAKRTHMPPTSVREWASLVGSTTVEEIGLLPGLLRPVSTLMNKHRVADDANFRAFVNEQLMISTQNTLDKAPYLIGALGLAYPSETYYPIGGMFAPALKLMRFLQKKKVPVKFRRHVTSIERSAEKRWTVTCANGEVYSAQRVISSIPIWNMPSMTDGRISSYYQKLARRFSFSWAAVTAYIAVEGTPEVKSPYTQLHVDDIPGISSGSLFVSVSHPSDTKKAPEGNATVTISTHARADEWTGLDTASLKTKKSQSVEAILNAVRNQMPELGDLHWHEVHGGTPQTWVRYTNRHNGFVGGIPHSTGKPIITLPPNKTPFAGLYQIGDSAFPGQGVPAVMTGAWNTVQRILAHETP